MSRNVLVARHRRRAHRRAARERQRAALTRGLGWIGSRLQSGQVGTYAWVLVDRRARGARRLHSPLIAMRAFLHSIGYDALDPAGAAGHSGRRRARRLLHGARRRREASDEARRRRRDVARTHRARARSLLEFVVSIGLWWIVRPGERRLAAPSSTCRGFRTWGIALHARRRRHLADDGAAHDVPHAARRARRLDERPHAKVHAYHALMLLLTTGMLGVFVARDLFLFYVMWEVMLVPMYFIIGIWGGERRIYAAQVLPLHDGRLAADARGDPVPRARRRGDPATGRAELRATTRSCATRAMSRRPRRSGCSSPSSSRSR